MALTQMSKSARVRLQTAFDRGDAPYVHGNQVYIARGGPPLKLRSANGELTTAGLAYEELLAARGTRPGSNEHTGLFDRDAPLVHRGRQLFAPDRGGRARLIRTFQPGTGEHKYTTAGQRYINESARPEVVVKIPATHYWWQQETKNNPGRWGPGYTHTPEGEREVLLVTGEELGLRLHPGADFAASIREAATRYIESHQTFDSEADFYDSCEKWTILPDAVNHLTYDIETVDAARHRTEVYLNRPLGARPIAPNEMWRKEGLFKAAWTDYQSMGENCVVQQLAIFLSDKDRGTTLTISEIEHHFDDILEQLYPGGCSAVTDPPKGAEDDFKPYVDAWKRYFKKGQFRSIAFLKAQAKNGHFKRDSGLDPRAFTALLKKHFGGKDYEPFFTHFGFSTHEGEILYSEEMELTPEEAEDLREQRAMEKTAPYTHAGWRQVGITLQMVIELAERLERPVRIIHNDRQIYDKWPSTVAYPPPSWHGREWIVISVWGDHAFFYEDVAGAQTLKVAAVKPPPELKLMNRVRSVDESGEEIDTRIPYHDLKPWSEEAFKEALSTPGSHKFRSDCIKKVIKYLEDHDHRFVVHWRTSTLPGSVSLLTRKIQIRTVPSHAWMLQCISDAFAKYYPGYRYYGQSDGSFAASMFDTMLGAHRPSHVDRQAVLDRQGGRCGDCGDHLTGRYEVHHEISIRDGGSSDPQNLRALCLACHGAATERQGRNRGRHSFWSELSPEAITMWMNTPKPPQLVWGSGAQRETPCLDVRSCRPSALLEEERLPVFGPTDDAEPYNVDRFESYDYFWVKRRFLQDDQEDLAPYYGEHLYCRYATKYMLDKGVIGHDNIAFGLRASRWVTGADLQAASDLLCRCVADAYDAIREHGDEHLPSVNDLHKRLRLAWIGVTNRVDTISWTVRKTTCIEDMGGRACIKSFDLDDPDVPYYKAYTQVLDSKTAFPIGLIALQKEQCFVDYGIRQLRNLGATILGVRVDGIFYTGVIAKCLEGDRFKIKTEPPGKVPCNAQKRPLLDVEPPKQWEWTTIEESIDCKIEVLVERVIENDGALITGYAGTGKTYFQKMLVERWTELEPDVKFIRGAPTHVAAKQMGGCTLERVRLRHRYTCPKNAVFIVDEISQVSMSLLALMARYRLLGARFVLLGDYDGQFKPIVDAWPTTRKAIDTQIVRELAGGLHVVLKTNRRAQGDDTHFDYYVSLYPHADKTGDELRYYVRDARTRYPWRLETPDVTIVLSHRKRMLVNAYYNRRNDSAGVYIPSVGELQGVASQPQDMLLKPGMLVLGASSERSKILNGTEYEVLEADKDGVLVQMTEEFGGGAPVLLNHHDASKYLRLGYAVCYYTVQGRTIRGRRVLLLDTGHRYFTMRHLIVGLSRVTTSSNMFVADPAMYRDLYANTSANAPASTPANAFANAPALDSSPDNADKDSDSTLPDVDVDGEWDDMSDVSDVSEDYFGDEE